MEEFQKNPILTNDVKKALMQKYGVDNSAIVNFFKTQRKKWGKGKKNSKLSRKIWNLLQETNSEFSVDIQLYGRARADLNVLQRYIILSAKMLRICDTDFKHISRNLCKRAQ